MPGLTAIFRKELADHFSSKRFVILFALVMIAGLGASYVAAQSIREELSRASGTSASVFLMLFTASDRWSGSRSASTRSTASRRGARSAGCWPSRSTATR
jgi:ABC-type transport system involved in multi-copper enzyme maturation permease subunit